MSFTDFSSYLFLVIKVITARTDLDFRIGGSVIHPPDTRLVGLFDPELFRDAYDGLGVAWDRDIPGDSTVFLCLGAFELSVE